jgi:hypothetical protein
MEEIKADVNTTEPKPPKTSGKKGVEFPKEKLLNLEEFKKYHPAFVRALLPNAVYTKKEARGIIKEYFTEKEKGGKK